MLCQAKHIGFKEIPKASSRFILEVAGEKEISVMVCNDCMRKMRKIVEKHLVLIPNSKIEIKEENNNV